MKRGIAIAASIVVLVSLAWFFFFSPYWWYTGRHVPPWPSGELPAAMYDAVTLTPATEEGEDACGAPFAYAFAGGVVADSGLYIDVVVEVECNPELPADAVAHELSTVLNLATNQWISITDPDGRPVHLGRTVRPAAVGPGKPDHISWQFGCTGMLKPREGRCRAVAIVWGKAPPRLSPGFYTIRTLDKASQIGLVTGQTYRIEVTKP